MRYALLLLALAVAGCRYRRGPGSAECLRKAFGLPPGTYCDTATLNAALRAHFPPGTLWPPPAPSFDVAAADSVACRISGEYSAADDAVVGRLRLESDILRRELFVFLVLDSTHRRLQAAPVVTRLP